MFLPNISCKDGAGNLFKPWTRTTCLQSGTGWVATTICKHTVEGLFSAPVTTFFSWKLYLCCSQETQGGEKGWQCRCSFQLPGPSTGLSRGKASHFWWPYLKCSLYVTDPCCKSIIFYKWMCIPTPAVTNT